MTAVTARPPVAGTPPVGGTRPVDGSRARLDAAVRLGAVVLLWSALLLVAYWWAAGGGFQDLRTLPTALDSTGRLTGLIASVLLLAQVLLMARIPTLEHAFGQDRLTRLHRLVGFTSFTLMLAHIGLITLGYADGRLRASVSTFWTLTVDNPGMLLAVAGTACLVMVVVTSIRAARRRLRYESWHLLHLYAYLGVFLALPHQLWTGQEFLTSPAATVYWWTLWAAAAGAVLVFRVGLPAYRSAVHGLRVVSVVRETDDVVSVTMRGRHLDRLDALPGQFLNWRFLTGPGWMRAHPYSLSAAPDGQTLRITVKDLGDGSGALADVEPGTRVLIEGPYGRLHPGVRTRRKVTLMASGIGISPMRSLLEGLPQTPGDVTLLYRARSEDDLALGAELERIGRERGARVVYILGRRIPGRDTWLPEAAAHLTDPEALRQLVPDIADHDVFLCGAAAWMEAAAAAARECGVPAQHIHLERFSW